MSQTSEILEQLEGTRHDIGGLRVEMTDLRKNERWRHVISRLLLGVAALVLIGTFFIVEAVVPWGYINKDGKRQSARIVGQLGARSVAAQYDGAERGCQLLGVAKVSVVLSPVTKQPLCVDGHAPPVPAAVIRALNPPPAPANHEWMLHVFVGLAVLTGGYAFVRHHESVAANAE